jgi:hypothetical protein
VRCSLVFDGLRSVLKLQLVQLGCSWFFAVFAYLFYSSAAMSAGLSASDALSASSVFEFVSHVSRVVICFDCKNVRRPGMKQTSSTTVCHRHSSLMLARAGQCFIMWWLSSLM